ncbi:hypothetical protein FPE01S_02_04470 [Flavihumibacter petaseus NBRC 106054]|uniref:Uncharacterized protein n=1 Tax=Flavihumibacter petaseus NBRC 106054 TaxID=1220578 RepID=A0A0E9N013_9BACT|nr:hypothetical protein FPE01S_02_04470 [Flavihumibacter petaseus NBRC 106054]
MTPNTTIKNILVLLSLGLLVWLFIDSSFQLDIAATKNNGLTNMKKMEVDRLQNIDSLKSIANTSIDIIRNNTKVNSALATKRLWIIATLGLIQICFLFLNKKK